MSTSNSASKSKTLRKTPIETIIKKFKSNQKKRNIKENHNEDSDINIKTNKPVTSKTDDVKSNQQEGDNGTDTADLLDVSDTTGLEYYPMKVKRDIVLRKVQMKSRHEMTVIAQTNKRKRSIPHKDSSSMSQNEDSSELDSKLSLKKALELKVPTETMYELIEETEKNGGLDDEDLQEILTCESPVWWEDAPDGYTEDPLFTRPRSATDMYPSVRTQLKRDFRELKRANSPIVLSKYKWNKENALQTTIKPRKRQHKDIDLTDGEVERPNEETERNDPSDIDLRLTLNNCDDTFKAKRSKLENTVKKISVTSNIVVCVKPVKDGDDGVCSQVSVIKNISSKCDQKEIREADLKHADNEENDITFHDDDCVNDLENINIPNEEVDEGITMKQLIPTINEVLCQNERHSQIIDDQQVYDDARIKGRQIINYSVDLQSKNYFENSDTVKTCESETNVCKEIRTNDNHDATNTDSEVSENMEDTQSTRIFEVTQINKCLEEIEITRNFEKAQSDNSFDKVQSHNIEEISSESLFEEPQCEDIAEEQSEKYFEDMVSDNYEDIQVAIDFKQRESKNYYKNVENETEQDETQNYDEVVQSYNVEEAHSRNCINSTQYDNFRQAKCQSSPGNSYDESQVATNVYHEESEFFYESVKTGLSKDVESDIFFHHREQSEVYSRCNKDIEPQNCVECIQSSSCKEIDENVEHVESGSYYEIAQSENTERVQSETYFECTQSTDKHEGVQVAINYEQESNLFFENTQPNNDEETEIDKNLERVKYKNYYQNLQFENIENVQKDNYFESMHPCNYEETQAHTNVKPLVSENFYEEVQSENVEQSENYCEAVQSGKYEGTQAVTELKQAESDSYYDNQQYQNDNQLQSENYFENMQSPSYKSKDGSADLQQTEADNYYEHAQPGKIENVQSENDYLDMQSSIYEEIQVDPNHRQLESENYYEDSQPGNYDKTKVVTIIKQAISENYHRDMQSEKIENGGTEKYLKSMHAGNYEETQVDSNFKQTESDSYYEYVQSEDKRNVESENYVQAIKSGNYEGTQVARNSLADSENFYEDGRSENFEESEDFSERVQSDDGYKKKQFDRTHDQKKSGNFETLPYTQYDQATTYEQTESENYYDENGCLSSQIQVDSNFKHTEPDSYYEYVQSENNGNVESENYVQAIKSGNYEGTQIATKKLAESEIFYENGRSENFEEADNFSGSDQAITYERAEPQHMDKQPNYIAEVQSEHDSVSLKPGKRYEEKKEVLNHMPGECENDLEVNNEPMDSDNYFEILQTENLEQEQAEKYVKVTQAATDAEQAKTEYYMKSVQTGDSFDEKKDNKTRNKKSVNDFLETNNCADAHSNINYEEIYTDSNFEDIHVSNYEEVQTVENCIDSCTAGSNQEVDTMNCNALSNLGDTQDASNFDMQSAINFKDILPISNLDNKETPNNLKETCVNSNSQETEMRNIYEDISTDSSDTQILRNIGTEPVNNPKIIRLASSTDDIQTIGNVKERTLASDLKKEPFTNYTSILEIFDSSFNNKQVTNELKSSTDKNIVSQQQRSDISLAIPTVSNVIVPTPTDTEDAQSSNILFKNHTDGKFLDLLKTSDIKLIPITKNTKQRIPTESNVGNIFTAKNLKKTAKNLNAGKLSTTKYDEIKNISSFKNIKENNNVKNVAIRNFNKQTTNNCETKLNLKHGNIKKRQPKKAVTLLKKHVSHVKSPVSTNFNKKGEATNGTSIFNGDEDVLEIENLLEVNFFEGEIERKSNKGNNSSLLKLESDDGSSIEVTRMQSVPRNLPPLKNSVKKHNAGTVPTALPPLKRYPASQLIKNNLDSISDTNLRFLNEADEDNSFSNNMRYKNVTESKKGCKSTKKYLKNPSFSNSNDITINDLNSNVQLYINTICQCGRNSHGTGNDVEIQSLTITKVNRPNQCIPKKTIESSYKSSQTIRKKANKNNSTKATTSNVENILGTDDSEQLQINLTKINNMTFCSEPTKSDSGEEYVTVFQIVSDDSIQEPQINLATDLFQHLSNISNTEIKSKDLGATLSNKNISNEIITVTEDLEKNNVSMKAKDLESTCKIIPSNNAPLELTCKNYEPCTNYITEGNITKSQNIALMNAQKDLSTLTEDNIRNLEPNNKIMPDKTMHESQQQLPIVFQENMATDTKKKEKKTRNYKPKSNTLKKINHYFKKCKNQKQQKGLGNKNLKSLDKNKRNKVKEDKIETEITKSWQSNKVLSTDSELTTQQGFNNELNNNKTDNSKVEIKEHLYKTRDKQINNAIPNHETYKKRATSKMGIVQRDVNEDFKKVNDTKSYDLPNAKPFRYCMICKSIFHTFKCNYCFGKKGEQLHKSVVKQCGPDYLIKMGQSFTCENCSYQAASKSSLERHILSKCCRSKR